jgi:hypothetical protein
MDSANAFSSGGHDNVKNIQLRFGFLQYAQRQMWLDMPVRLPDRVFCFIPRNPMKISFIQKSATAVMLALLACSSLRASLTLSDNFSYSTGDLIGQGGWQSSDSSGTATVESATLTPFSSGGLEVLAVGNEVALLNKTVFRNIGITTSHVSGDSLYISLIANVTNGNQFAGLKLKDSSSGRQLLIGQTYNNSNWGMAVDGGTGSTMAVNSTSSNGSISLLIARIEYVSSTTANITLYVNPTVSGIGQSVSITSMPSASISGVDIGGFDRLLLVGTASKFTVDSILLGTTLQDVVSLASIPEPATSVLLVSGTVLMICIVGRFRRKC